MFFSFFVDFLAQKCLLIVECFGLANSAITKIVAGAEYPAELVCAQCCNYDYYNGFNWMISNYQGMHVYLRPQSFYSYITSI